MINKRYIAAFMGFLFLSIVLYTSSVSAVDETILNRKLTMEEAVAVANQEIGLTYYAASAQVLINGVYMNMELNRSIWDTQEILVYGSPEAVPTSEQDFDKGHYRYLGYTINGDLMPDPDFREDHSSTTLINNYDWKREPWRPQSGLGLKEDFFDGLSDNLPYIKEGLRLKYAYKPSLYSPSVKPRNATGTDEDWHTVTKILQPRTSVTPGLGRMWHNWNGAWWYITVFIPVELPPDIEITAISSASPVNTKTGQTAIAAYKNNSSESQTFEAIFIAGGERISSENITLAAGQETTRSYNWTAPETPGQVILQAEARPVPNETILTNNLKTLTINVEQPLTPKEPVSLPCAEKPSITNTWEELYEWEVYHPATCSGTDEKGNPYDYDCSWTEYKSEIVTYQETLSAMLTVNTKQGIAGGGRESRGAWEIIPYAKKKGLDPNEVTRSGYGFEVKIVTAYDNDWESKVPGGASPHGGTFRGPDEAAADFYDTKGRFVERTKLVPTKGQAGDRNITWELPSQKYTFQDGTAVYERKHYTDINVPDGKYLVKVTVSGAGKTNLCLIQKKYVTIYKDLWEDSYTRVAGQDE